MDKEEIGCNGFSALEVDGSELQIGAGFLLDGRETHALDISVWYLALSGLYII